MFELNVSCDDDDDGEDDNEMQMVMAKRCVFVYVHTLGL